MNGAMVGDTVDLARSNRLFSAVSGSFRANQFINDPAVGQGGP